MVEAGYRERSLTSMHHVEAVSNMILLGFLVLVTTISPNQHDGTFALKAFVDENHKFTTITCQTHDLSIHHRSTQEKASSPKTPNL
jgi:hypothetical protein